MLKEFKEFISKGNVLDLAVAVIMATYFGAIIKSLVSDMIMPVIGLAMGGIDFKDAGITLSEATYKADGTVEKAASVLAYGKFVDTIIVFVIVAFVIFMIVRAFAKMKKKEEAAPAAPPAPTKEEVLLTEIRDALRK